MTPACRCADQHTNAVHMQAVSISTRSRVHSYRSLSKFIQMSLRCATQFVAHRLELWVCMQGARELTFSLQLKADSGLVVVPYCTQPGQEGPFVLRTFSSIAIEMTQVQSQHVQQPSMPTSMPTVFSTVSLFMSGAQCAFVQPQHFWHLIVRLLLVRAGAIASGSGRGRRLAGAPGRRPPAAAVVAIKSTVHAVIAAARRGDAHTDPDKCNKSGCT
jgi:hypothetical protein